MAMRRPAAESEADRLHSVKRALAVLETLASQPLGVTPKELSQQLGLHLSTSYRLLNTLVAAGYVSRDPANGLFRLAQRVAYLHNGYLATLSPPPGVLPFIHALQAATGETAMLTQFEGDDVVCSAVVPGTRPNAFASIFVGMAAPAHAAAAGRALLAGLPPAELEAYLARAAGTPDSPFPIANLSALQAELNQIRQTGYALDRGEGHPDACCVAAPVPVQRGASAMSVSVLVSCARLRCDEAALVATTLAVARAIGDLPVDGSTPGGTSAGEESAPAAQAEIDAVLLSVAEVMSRVS
jgi:DNA-binding IclR family transcriptional regulator